MIGLPIEIRFLPSDLPTPAGAVVAVFLFSGEPFHGLSDDMDVAGKRALMKSIEQRRFTAEAGATLEVLVPTYRDMERFVLVGLGMRSAFNDMVLERAAASAYAAVQASGAEILELRTGDMSAEQAARAAFGVLLGAYRFERHVTKPKPGSAATVCKLCISCLDSERAQECFKSWRSLAKAIYFSRNLVSEPGNVLFPAIFADRLLDLRGIGVDVDIMGEAEMAAAGMGALLGVGQGSRRESKLAVLRWNGAAEDNPPIAFVGKGICFDTGGISLKTGGGMESMIWDMAGAGAVAGAILALAGRNAPINAVGVVALAENMPDGNAIRPGDIITSMSGQTIEVISTDAEGRLVLADALWYCQTTYAPRVVIDLATLTGASQIALGSEFAALFANSDSLAQKLLAAGETSGDRLWRLPLSSLHEKTLETSRADMKNYHDNSGGAINGALFLQRFLTATTTAWAHIDMTPTAWWSSSQISTIPSGATGFGVRLLDEFVRQGSNFDEFAH